MGGRPLLGHTWDFAVPLKPQAELNMATERSKTISLCLGLCKCLNPKNLLFQPLHECADYFLAMVKPHCMLWRNIIVSKYLISSVLMKKFMYSE